MRWGSESWNHNVAQLLSRHKQIFLPHRKEIHYFSLNFAKNIHWYQNWFGASQDYAHIGEITPYYIFHPHVAGRIKKTLGKIKIIILLRDPVERALSHYYHSLNLGFETLPVEDAFAAENGRIAGADIYLKANEARHKLHQECSYLSRSLYKEQVERYWDFFGVENVLIIPSELFFSDPNIYLNRIFDFLGVEPIYRTQNSSLFVNANLENQI